MSPQRRVPLLSYLVSPYSAGSTALSWLGLTFPSMSGEIHPLLGLLKAERLRWRGFAPLRVSESVLFSPISLDLGFAIQPMQV